MKVKFLGATKTVTGSRYLVTHGQTKVLVDCGLFQGFKHLRLRNWEKFPVPVSDLSAVVLTHAHVDHSGYLPLLAKQGYQGQVYATPATIALCRILLPDSGHLQEEEARFANKRGYSKHKPALPLYTVEDAKNSLKLLTPVPWRKPVRVSNHGLGTIEFEFHPAGHLLGAASVLVKGDGSTIAFSGDLGRKSDPLIRDPAPGFSADALVVESTYGDRKHPGNDPQEELEAIIRRTTERGGLLLIPSFAVGRAQLILYFLLRLKRAGRLPNIPIYLNSPMAAEAVLAFSAHPGELKIDLKEITEISRMVRVIHTAEESKILTSKTESAIIIAASGMATGGRVLHHLKEVAPEEKNTILFVGFQAGGTRGEAMVKGAEKIKIHGDYWPVKAEVVNMENLSSHADADEILAWISSLKKKPRRVFVTHGEPETSEVLAKRITQELGMEAIVPSHEQELEVG